MSDIMAKDRVKRLIVQRMMDAGWRMPTGASMDFLVDEYIRELRHFTEDELNAAWNHVRNHSDESDRAWRYWPPAVAFKKAATRARIDKGPESTGNAKAFNAADERARKYASDRIWANEWTFHTRRRLEIKQFITDQAREQILAGLEPNVTIPEHKLNEWKASVVEPLNISTPRGMKQAGEAVE